MEAGSWTERNRNLSGLEENAEGEARAALDTIDPDSYIQVNDIRIERPPNGEDLDAIFGFAPGET